MKTLYFDCGMGAAGDMLTAALLELLPNPDAFVDELNHLGIPGVVFKAEPSVKCGITGTHMSVTVNGESEESCDYEHHHEHEHSHAHDHDHLHEAETDHEHAHCHSHEQEHDHSHHAHSGLHEIEHIVRGHLNLPKAVQDDIMAVYGLIAEAESKVHGVPVSEIHFHEVGSVDAVADITAVCMLMNKIKADEVVVSPIHTGCGQVRCAHGILPVPAPAAAYILKGIPVYGGAVRGELCTPTGAALLKHFATRFGDMPVMKPTAIGYGMGKKNFEAANCVRVILGEKDQTQDEIYELSCNVDDMTGEAVGFAIERLLEAGAVDAYTIPIGMKKSRPGVLLSAMCHEKDRERLVQAMFKHTTTLGIREKKLNRYVLDRRVETAETAFGAVKCKVSAGYGVERRKYEYEDLSRIAKEKDLSITEVLTQIKAKNAEVNPEH